MKEKLSYTRVLKSRAVQWCKQGDHEGVALFGAGDVLNPDLPCPACKNAMGNHGELKDDGQTVCPGDWIVEDAFTLNVISDSEFRKQYVENTGSSISARGVQGEKLKLEIELSGLRRLKEERQAFVVTGHPKAADGAEFGPESPSISAAGAAPPTLEFRKCYGRGLFTTSVDGPIKAVVDGVEVPIPKLVEEIERLLAAALQSLSDSEARCDKLRRFKEQFWGMINMERMRDPEIGLRTIIRRLNKGDSSEPTHLGTHDSHGWNSVMDAFGVTSHNLTPLTFNGLNGRQGSFAVEIDGKRAHVFIAPLTWDSLQEQWSQALFSAHGCSYEQALEAAKKSLKERMEGIPGTLEAIAKDKPPAVGTPPAKDEDEWKPAEGRKFDCSVSGPIEYTKLPHPTNADWIWSVWQEALSRSSEEECREQGVLSAIVKSYEDEYVRIEEGSDDECDEPSGTPDEEGEHRGDLYMGNVVRPHPSEPEYSALIAYGGFSKDSGMRLEVQVGEHLGGYLYMSAKEFENLAIQFNRDNVSYHGKTLYETLGSEPVFVSADSEEVRKLYAKISSDRSFEIEQLKLGHRGEQKRLSNRIADLKKELKVLRDHEEVARNERAESPPIPPIDSGSLYEPPTESPSPSPESGWSYLQASLEQYKNNQTAVRERQAARERKSDAMLTISDKGAIVVKKSFHEIDIGEDETHSYLGTIWGGGDEDQVALSPARSGIRITLIARLGNIILRKGSESFTMTNCSDSILLAKKNNSWHEVQRLEYPLPDMMDPATGKDRPTTEALERAAKETLSHLAIRNPGPFEVIILSVHEDNFESVASLIDDEFSGGGRPVGMIHPRPLKGGVTLPLAEKAASMLRDAGAVVKIQREKGFTRQFGPPAEKPEFPPIDGDGRPFDPPKPTHGHAPEADWKEAKGRKFDINPNPIKSYDGNAHDVAEPQEVMPKVKATTVESRLLSLAEQMKRDFPADTAARREKLDGVLTQFTINTNGVVTYHGRTVITVNGEPIADHKDYCTADGCEDYDENGTCLECGEENTQPSWITSGTNKATEEVTDEFQTAIFLLLENLNKRVEELSKSVKQAIVTPNDHQGVKYYDVILRTTRGAKKIQAIKGIIAVVPGCSLSEAKNICETTPKVLRRWVALSLAEEFAELLAKAGCTVDIGEIGSGKIIATRSGSDRTAEHPNWNCGNSSYPKCTMPFKATGPEPHRDMKPTITAQPEMQTDGYLGEDQGNDGPPEPTSKPTEPVADSLVPGRFGKFDKNDPVSFWGSVKDVAHKKILIALGGKEVWITKSDIVDGSALTGLSRQFDHGILIIPRWVAVDNGLGIMARLLPPELAGNTKEMAIQLYDAAKLYKDFTFDIISEQEQEHWLDKARDILAPYCHGIEPEPPGSVLDAARRGYRCDCSDCLEARAKVLAKVQEENPGWDIKAKHLTFEDPRG